MSFIWPSREPRRQTLEVALANHSAHQRHLPGIDDPRARFVLSAQLIASLRREEYTKKLMGRTIGPKRADPHDPAFDADRAIIYHLQNGNIDEAAWLVFLVTHFGKPADTRWRRLSDVYGRLGAGRWDWASVSADPGAFRAWLAVNSNRIGGRFGNHRKYETLRADSANGTADVVESYVRWIGPSRSHAVRFAEIVRNAGNDPHSIFDAMYRGMNVKRFGRLARFDYLCLIGRLGIAPIEPGKAYLEGATGPAKGARLLFDGGVDGNSTREDLQRCIDDLAPKLAVGMQVMEDALCNWQKCPTYFVHFEG